MDLVRSLSTQTCEISCHGVSVFLTWLTNIFLRLRRIASHCDPPAMPTISVDKAALFKELGREYVLI